MSDLDMKKKECEGSFSQQTEHDLKLLTAHLITNGAGIGLCLGVVVGSLTDNMGLWLSLGLCLGAGVGSVSKKGKESMSEGFDAEGSDAEAEDKE